MKKFVALILIFMSSSLFAADKRSLSDVSINEITADTQMQPDNSGDKHLTFVWWVPFEYWASVFTRDKNMPENVKNEMLAVLKEYTVLAIVQADVSNLGAFNFYSKKEVLKNLEVSYEQPKSLPLKIIPTENISGDMEIIVSTITPILKAAMGNLGSNLNFFVYSDKRKDNSRLIDPYSDGDLVVKLKKSDGENISVNFKTPLNSLFIPRICPNGEKAHVSWNYCPWSGKKI